MSQSFYWQPVKLGKHIPISAPSSFREAMEEVFGNGPSWRLDAGSVSTLNGMRAAMKHERDGFDAILDAIDKHEVIDVTAGS